MELFILKNPAKHYWHVIKCYKCCLR